jgi:dihydrofolate reductase
MRKVKLFIACSLDGYIAREDGSVDWLFSDQDYGFRSFLRSIDTMLMGRKTYEKALELGDDSHKSKRWVVFTRKPGDDGRGLAEFVREPVPFVRELLSGEGRDVWLVGGAQALSVLLEAGLVDELILFVHPIILGSGIPLFRKDGSRSLELSGTRRFGSGLVRLHYKTRKG